MSSFILWFIWIICIAVVFITCFAVVIRISPREYSYESILWHRYKKAMDAIMSALQISYCLAVVSILWETGATLVRGEIFIAIGPFVLSILASALAIYATHCIVTIHKTDTRLNPYQNKFFGIFKKLKPIFY